MKKIMILGASILQIPAIKKQSKWDYMLYVLISDPMAIGFKYADEYYVISTTDTENILRFSNEKELIL